MIDFLRLRGLRPVRVEETEHDLHVYAESTQTVSACIHCTVGISGLQAGEDVKCDM